MATARPTATPTTTPTEVPFFCDAPAVPTSLTALSVGSRKWGLPELYITDEVKIGGTEAEALPEANELAAAEAISEVGGLLEVDTLARVNASPLDSRFIVPGEELEEVEIVVDVVALVVVRIVVDVVGLGMVEFTTA